MAKLPNFNLSIRELSQTSWIQTFANNDHEDWYYQNSQDSPAEQSVEYPNSFLLGYLII